MSSNNNSSSAKNNVPEAREAMEKFKYEVANEIGVPLKQGYNGDLTSAQNGYVGGYMVNNICPERTRNFLRNKNKYEGTMYAVSYTYYVTI